MKGSCCFPQGSEQVPFRACGSWLQWPHRLFAHVVLCAHQRAPDGALAGAGWAQQEDAPPDSEELTQLPHLQTTSWDGLVSNAREQQLLAPGVEHGTLALAQVGCSLKRKVLWLM